MENRREFLKKASAAAALTFMMDWAMGKTGSDRLGDILPQRQLIRNGEKVTAFSLGGYHLGLDGCSLGGPADDRTCPGTGYPFF